MIWLHSTGAGDKILTVQQEERGIVNTKEKEGKKDQLKSLKGLPAPSCSYCKRNNCVLDDSSIPLGFHTGGFIFIEEYNAWNFIPYVHRAMAL